MYKAQTNDKITYLKAIGIMLMVLGHCGCSIPFVVQFLYMFHMPLFFFASGYCFKRIYLSEPFIFLKKRIIGVYVPFVKWSVLFLFLHNLFFRFNIYNDEFGFRGNVSHVYNISETIKHLVNIITVLTDNEQLLGGFWFLRSLFFGSIISWIALRIFRRPWMCVIGILLVCLGMNKTIYEIPILKLHTCEFAAALVILIGHCFSYYKIASFNKIFITFCFGLTFIGSFYWFMQLGDTSYSNKIFPEYILTAVLSTWSIYSIFDGGFTSKCFLSHILQFIGNNTLTILTWHFLSFKIVSLLIIYTYDLQIERLAEFPTLVEYSSKGWWIAYIIVGLTIPLSLSLIKQRIFSYIYSWKKQNTIPCSKNKNIVA